MPLLLILLTGCNFILDLFDKDEEPPDRLDSVVVPETGARCGDWCDLEIEATVPESGGTLYYHFAPVEFWLADPIAHDDDCPIIGLSGPNGGVGGHTSFSEDGEVIYFTPTDPLKYCTPYTAELHACGADVSLPFTTDGCGSYSLADIEGITWAMDFSAIRMIEPEGVGPLVAKDVTSDSMLQVIDYNGQDPMQMRGALGHKTFQNLCVPTGEHIGLRADRLPYFEIGPTDIPFVIEGAVLEVSEATVTASIAWDGSYLYGGTITGVFDARLAAAELTELVESAEDVCELAAAFGAICETCSDGQPYCISVRADQIRMNRVEGLDLVEISKPGPECGE